MGFLAGRATWERFDVGGKAETLTQKHVDVLEQHAFKSHDGSGRGFIAGDHVLDFNFGLEKNLVNDALHAAIRVDTIRIPGELKKAWLEMELAERAADNPSGFPTRKQRQEVKEAVEERCVQEAEAGKYRSSKSIPFLWDSRNDVVYLASASETTIERFVPMFEEAFSRPLTHITSGVVAQRRAKETKTATDDDLTPAAFFGMVNKSYAVSWLSGGSSSDFLGNEFLLWLWWNVEAETDSIRLADDSAVAVMMSRTLGLECPLAETGKETISHESPIRLPEAKHAVRLGKLPRRSGLTLVRHDEQYELKLAAETLGVSSAALPKLDSETFAAQRQDRVDQIRHLSETVDLLFGVFIDRRLASTWQDELKRIRAWLREDDDAAEAA